MSSLNSTRSPSTSVPSGLDAVVPTATTTLSVVDGAAALPIHHGKVQRVGVDERGVGGDKLHPVAQQLVAQSVGLCCMTWLVRIMRSLMVMSSLTEYDSP